MPTTTCDVIVLGGGPAGVATALEAAERGYGVVLLEREASTGGMAGSFDLDGTRVDFGSHRLHPVTPPAVMARLRALLGDDLQVRPRHGRLRLGDRWVEFPLRPADMARSMPRTWLLQVAKDAALGPIRGRRTATETDDSYAARLRSSLGPTVYDSLYAPYAEKLWGLPGEDIDAEQARVRVSADTVPKVAGRVLRSAGRSAGRSLVSRLPTRVKAASSSGPTQRSAPQGATFNYPRRGFGQITEALDGAARAAGVQILTGVTVGSVVPGPLVEVTSTSGGVWSAPRVLSTLPIPLLARLSEPGPPPEIVDDAKALRFRAMTLVYLTLTRDPSSATPASTAPASTAEPLRWSSYDAHYLPGAGTPITRVSEPANYRVSPDDPADRSVICAEIPCTIGDDIWTANGDTLLALVHRAAADFDLPTLHVAAVTVRRLPSVYPIYEHGFADRLARLEDWADGIPGVTTLGRSGLFAHDNTHHAFVMAAAVAEALRPDGTFDDAQWRRSRESFRSHIVED